MSDGDNATPGRRRHRAPEPDADSQWITRSRRAPSHAAPWERLDRADDHSFNDDSFDDDSFDDDSFDDSFDYDDRFDELDQPVDEPSGSHTDGVTVADLIARMSGQSAPPPPPAPPPAAPPAPPRRAPRAPEPPPRPTDILPVVRVAPVRRDTQAPATDVIPVVPPPDVADDWDVPVAILEDHLGDIEDFPEAHPVWRAGRAAHDPPRHTEQTDVIPPTRPVHRGAMRAGRAIAAIFAVMTLALTGSAWQWQSSKNDLLNKVSALDPESGDVVNPGGQTGDVNFLIVGIDSRFGDNGQMGAGGTEDAGGARSDTIMLVNIPSNRKRVVAVSFPRDLAITPMKCEPWNPETAAYGPLYDADSETYGPDEVYTETKLNSAFAFGGPRCLVKVIQKISGLSINRFMAVDFAGFAKMVDALGGVEVCSTTPLEDYELGTVLANAGRQTVDGKTALNYVRARQVTTEFNGDYGRIKRQQLFLSSLLRSLISKDTFMSLSKLNNVVNMFVEDSYVDGVTTKDLVELGQSVQGVNAGRMTFVTIPTVGYADEEGNETPRTDDVHALFDAIINDDPLPGEKNADNTPVPGTPESTASTALQSEQSPSTATTPQEQPAAPADEPADLVDAVTTDPQDVTVRVSNSTGQSGLAASAATELHQHGFQVVEPDDYPDTLAATTVFFSPGNEEAAATVASAFNNPTIERVTGMGNTVRVVLGSDFNSVNAPTPSGSSVQVHVMHGTRDEPTHLPDDLTVTNAADSTCK